MADPEGHTDRLMSPGEMEPTKSTSFIPIVRSNDNKNDDNERDCQTKRRRIMTGKAIFSYAEPSIFTAIVIPDKHPDNTSYDNLGDDDDDNSSLNSNNYDNNDDDSDYDDMPPLMDTSLYVPTSSPSSISLLKETSTQTSTSEESSESDNKIKMTGSIINKYSIVLGLLIGMFIQSSSLGANYILTVFFGHDYKEIQHNQQHVVLFSLGWSFLTSIMGVLVLLFLRTILKLASQTTTSNNQQSMNAYYGEMEYSYAFGALVGVCLSWTATDLVLGLQVHAYHSIMTLSFAVMVKLILHVVKKNCVVNKEDKSSSDLSKPLLMDHRHHQDEDNDKEVVMTQVHTQFKYKGLFLGLLIGFFIQFSSLGASFLMDTIYGNNDNGNSEEENQALAVVVSRQFLLFFSLGWSFVFGTMGVTILVLLRSLVLMVLGEITSSLTLHLEFYFAVGCLVGVNVAWVLTDFGLGLEAHMIKSILTLVAAGLWCKALACCFFTTTTTTTNNNNNTIDIIESTSSRQSNNKDLEILIV